MINIFRISSGWIMGEMKDGINLIIMIFWTHLLPK